MKKKVRRVKSCAQQTEEEKPGGKDPPTTDSTSDLSETKDEGEESKSRCAGRMSTAVCRLCHGKFYPRSLTHAFDSWPQSPLQMLDSAAGSPLLFQTDFQRLVGVRLDRDPELSEFICKKCHAKFYKCHSILLRFLQRVNLPAAARGNRTSRSCPNSPANISAGRPSSFTSDPKCLHSLVTWVHRHGAVCSSCPDLKEVLGGQCWGSVRAVWGCGDGHRYVMDTQSDAAPYLGRQTDSSPGVSGRNDEDDEEESSGTGTAKAEVQRRTPPEPEQDPVQDDWVHGEGEVHLRQPWMQVCDQVTPQNRTADSEPSERGVSEEEVQEAGGRVPSDEDRTFMTTRRQQNPETSEEPRVRRKPGPKPGWKTKFRPKAEELPNIYKCPYQGCTAVYRAPDGLKKHIKEHHEDMRERPCPHPGCNKVFMIDRYLQRHIKLIHTEERNYICDQCGQTFKQRKHLSVHQMRHSGAKPLQCEVCGFQCRQRASLKYHMTKHKAESDLDFECPICRKRFEKAHNLNVHVSMVHPLVLAEAQRAGAKPDTQLQTIGLTGELLQQDQDR